MTLVSLLFDHPLPRIFSKYKSREENIDITRIYIFLINDMIKILFKESVFTKRKTDVKTYDILVNYNTV